MILKINRQTVFAFILTTVTSLSVTGCSSYEARFANESNPYFCEDHQGSRYYSGTSYSRNHAPSLRSMSYGNTGRPSDALGAVILAVPLAVYSVCVGGLYACELIGSTVVDTLLLPLDAGVQQFDKDEQSDLTNSKASEVEAESKPKTPSK